MTAHTFTIEPHPTCKGKLLAVSPKPASWHCATDTERAFHAIGATHWRLHRGEGVAYTLSPAQARDVDAILRAGFLTVANTDWIVEQGDAVWWHPDEHDDYLTRADVLALIAPPPRCPRTLDMFA